MFERIREWGNERWPLSDLIRLGLEEDMPGGTSFAYIFGSAVFLTFIIQVVRGIWELFHFTPTMDHTYDSLSYFRLQVPFGWLMHNLHRYGADAMIILLGLHMSRVFFWKPTSTHASSPGLDVSVATGPRPGRNDRP